MSRILIFCLFFALPRLLAAQSGDTPLPLREFRGVWITTLANLDWPKANTGDVPEQQKEFREILDKLHRLNFNAVVVQVRPSADAFYPSPYEPWSEWLSGKQGMPPAPYYDPLQFMIEECHRRGIEFHAWFNLFRAVSHIRYSRLEENNYAGCHPEQVYLTGKSLWFDPGIPEVQQRIVSIVSDVVTRYEVDGIHFDDYFYPYGNDCNDFDTATFRQYGTGFADIGDWRRDNVNTLIKTVSQNIKNIKPYVVFGVSPHCVWRNKNMDSTGSESGNATGSYDKLYADTKKWFTEGWIDYVAPQLYRSIHERTADYETLLRWWTALNAPGKVIVGHALYKTDPKTDEQWKHPDEVVNQIKMAHRYGAAGSIFFRLSNLLHNPAGILDSLAAGLYASPAQVPSFVFSPYYSAPVFNEVPGLVLDMEADARTVRCIGCCTEPGTKYIFRISDANRQEEKETVIHSRIPAVALPPGIAHPKIKLVTLDAFNHLLPESPEVVFTFY